MLYLIYLYFGPHYNRKGELIFSVGAGGYLDTGDHDPITFNMGKGLHFY